MNKYGKQHKPPNAMVRNCMQIGSKHKIGTVTYMGAVPEYSAIRPDPLGPVTYVKVRKGIPFVKVSSI